MPDTRQELLAQLDREALHAGLDSVTHRVIREEMEAHLDASVQARLEMGEDVGEAERNSVLAFGDPRKLIQSMAQIHRPTWCDRRFFWTIVPSALAVLLASLLGTRGVSAPSVFLWVVMPLIVGFHGLLAWESVRARVVQLAACVGIFVGVLFISAASASVSLIPPTEEHATFSRDMGRGAARNLRNHAALLRTGARTYDLNRGKFAQGEAIGPILTGKPRSLISYEPMSPASAALAWANTDATWRPAQESFIRSDLRDAERLEEEVARSWLLGIPAFLGDSCQLASSAAIYVLVLNGSFAFLGWLLRWARRSGAPRSAKLA